MFSRITLVLSGYVCGLLAAFYLRLAPATITQLALSLILALGTIYAVRRTAWAFILIGITLSLLGAFQMRRSMEAGIAATPAYSGQGRWAGSVVGKVHAVDPDKMEIDSREWGRLVLHQPRWNHPAVRLPPMIEGSEVRCDVVLKRPTRQTVPGGFDQSIYYISESIAGTGYLKNCQQLTLPTKPTWRQKFRDTTLAVLQTSASPEARGVLMSMFLGDKGYLSEAMHTVFRRSGLYHILVVSGMNLAMLGGVVYFGAAVLLSLYAPLLQRINRHLLASAAAFTGMGFYLYLVGAQPPVLRAFYVATLFILTLAVRRPFEPLYALQLAVLLLLLLKPFYLFSVSFQLTVAATVGILLGVRRCRGWTHRRWLNIAIMAAAASCFAYLFTLPVTLYHFHRLCLWSLPSNLVYGPWIGWLLMPLGFAGMALAPLHSGTAGILLKCAAWLTERLIEQLRWVAQLPGADAGWATPPMLAIALWYAGLLLFAVGHRRRWILCCGLAVLCVLPWNFRREVRGAILEVGDGLAVVLEVLRPPFHRQVVIIDTGPPQRCRNSLLAYLDHRGVRRITALYLSHWDQDHVGCVGVLAERYPIDAIYAAYAPPPEKAPDLPVTLLKTGQQQSFDALKLHVVYASDAPLMSSNNRSLVLSARYRATEWLMPGDIEREVEPAVIQAWEGDKKREPFQPLMLLVAPHHGSFTSSSRPFVESLRPEHVVFSRWKAPGKGVVERYQAVGSRPYFTRRSGSLLFTALGNDLVLEGSACDSDGTPYNGWGICP